LIAMASVTRLRRVCNADAKAPARRAELARQPADGYTPFSMAMPLSVVPALCPELKIDLRRDLEPITQFAWSSFICARSRQRQTEAVHLLQ